MFLQSVLVTLPNPVPWQGDNFLMQAVAFTYRTLLKFRRRLHEVRVSCVCCALACDEEPRGEWAAAVGRMSAWIHSHAVPLDAILLHVGSTVPAVAAAQETNKLIFTETRLLTRHSGRIQGQVRGNGQLENNYYVEWDSRVRREARSRGQCTGYTSVKCSSR